MQFTRRKNKKKLTFPGLNVPFDGSLKHKLMYELARFRCVIFAVIRDKNLVTNM